MSLTTEDSFRRELHQKLLIIGAFGDVIRQIKKSKSYDFKKVAALEVVKLSIKDQLEALISAVPDQTNCSKTVAFNSSLPDNNVVKEQPFAEVEHMSSENQPITTASEVVKTSSYDDETDSYDGHGNGDDDMDEDETSSYVDETDSYDEHGHADDDMDEDDYIDHDCEKCCFAGQDDRDYIDEEYKFEHGCVSPPSNSRDFEVETESDMWEPWYKPRIIKDWDFRS